MSNCIAQAFLGNGKQLFLWEVVLMAMSLFILDDTTMVLRFGWKFVLGSVLVAWRCEGKTKEKII